MEFPQRIKNKTTIWTRKGKKGIQIEVEEIQLSFFTDYMIILKNLNESTKKFFKLISGLNKVARYKVIYKSQSISYIDCKKSIHFLYFSNERVDF